MKHHIVFNLDRLSCLKFPLLKKPLHRKQMILPITILAIFSLMMTAFSPVKQGPKSAVEPSPRDYVAFAYDSQSDQIILFGGGTQLYQYHHADKETWAYDIEENTWTNMKPAPKPRNMAAATMAYDSESDRVILFGGCLGQTVWNETWAYDYESNTWTKMSDGPEGLMGPRMVYDEESDKMILFGGVDYDTFSFYDDTWVYDYNSDTWTEMQPEENPPGLNYQAMAYDAESDRVLISAMHPVNGIPSDEYILWAYDYNSNTWGDLSLGNTEPLSRVYAAMAYDAESDRSIMFGGLDFMSGYVYDDTWAYDYNSDSWQEMDPIVNPGNLSKHFMVYVSSEDKVYLFGGDLCTDVCQLSNQLWTYDFNTNTWEQIIPGT
jgi:N-acetylneuraminic acid mutarotase